MAIQLPQQLQDTFRFLKQYNEQHIGEIVLDENSIGRPAVRMRSTQRRKKITTDLKMTQEDFENWSDFFFLQLLNGAESFIDAKGNVWRFAIEDMGGSFYSSYTFQNKNYVKITVILEVL